MKTYRCKKIGCSYYIISSFRLIRFERKCKRSVRGNIFIRVYDKADTTNSESENISNYGAGLCKR